MSLFLVKCGTNKLETWNFPSKLMYAIRILTFETQLLITCEWYICNMVLNKYLWIKFYNITKMFYCNLCPHPLLFLKQSPEKIVAWENVGAPVRVYLFFRNTLNGNQVGFCTQEFVFMQACICRSWCIDVHHRNDVLSPSYLPVWFIISDSRRSRNI